MVLIVLLNIGFVYEFMEPINLASLMSTVGLSKWFLSNFIQNNQSELRNLIENRIRFI